MSDAAWNIIVPIVVAVIATFGSLAVARWRLPAEKAGAAEDMSTAATQIVALYKAQAIDMEKRIVSLEGRVEELEGCLEEKSEENHKLYNENCALKKGIREKDHGIERLRLQLKAHSIEPAWPLVDIKQEVQ